MKLLPVEYLGSTAMDKRFSTPMLPWIIAEIRRRNTVDKICVGVEDGTVQAYDKNFEMQFTHKIQQMLRFSRAIQDSRSFMYLLKDPEKPLLYCHLFRASRPDDCEGFTEHNDSFLPEEFASEPRKFIPLWYKQKAVAIAHAHPKWS